MTEDLCCFSLRGLLVTDGESTVWYMVAINPTHTSMTWLLETLTCFKLRANVGGIVVNYCNGGILKEGAFD